jgi:hypothetical protein
VAKGDSDSAATWTLNIGTVASEGMVDPVGSDTIVETWPIGLEADPIRVEEDEVVHVARVARTTFSLQV